MGHKTCAAVAAADCPSCCGRPLSAIELSIAKPCLKVNITAEVQNKAVKPLKMLSPDGKSGILHVDYGARAARGCGLTGLTGLTVGSR